MMPNDWVYGLSLWAPWPWAILNLGKDIENRDWETKVRGRILLHQSKNWNASRVWDEWRAMELMARRTVSRDGLWQQMQETCGCLVGSVEIVGCVSKSESRWFRGRYGFVLRNPLPLPKPIPWTASQRLFHVPRRVLQDQLSGQGVLFA